jgi:hypothetical protein
VQARGECLTYRACTFWNWYPALVRSVNVCRASGAGARSEERKDNLEIHIAPRFAEKKKGFSRRGHREKGTEGNDGAARALKCLARATRG